MGERPRFGTAGIPHSFRLLKMPTSELPRFLREQRLDALEYEAVHWGKRPQTRQREAEKLGISAEEHDVWLSLHSSYYINLLGDEKVLEASKKRLIASATAAHWMRAHTVTFHPGYYSNKHSRMTDLRNCVSRLQGVVAVMRSMNIRANLGPETSGRLSQLGSLEEIIAICESVEQTQPVVDWAHIHARRRGSLRTARDFREIVETVERRLGTRAVRYLHCHFSLVEYSFRGERRHHPLGTLGFGPDFDSLAQVIADLDLKPVVICESPLLYKDAKSMRDTVYRKLGAVFLR
ncbi:MAG: TIM barrel protein [Candidatus Bathyarchaeota archaeon]|nr:MAG: TIM barrel protein [Candidatus Bathyarchaeota archaeon]